MAAFIAGKWTSELSDDIGEYPEGLIIPIDKPYRWTSADAVRKVKWAACRHFHDKKLKVGHAGTLDPLATGVLLICIGKATKIADELQRHDKEYVATLQLGQTTPSFDAETEVDATFPTGHIDLPLIERTLRERFLGRIEQVPPTFSAIRVDGKRAYEYARSGRHDEVELSGRPVDIHSIAVEAFDKAGMTLRLRVECGKGTYVRALARDIGAALGSGAYLTSLRRTRVGDMTVDDALTMEQVEELIMAQRPAGTPAPRTTITEE